MSDKVSIMPIEYFMQIHQEVYKRLCLVLLTWRTQKISYKSYWFDHGLWASKQITSRNEYGQKKDGKKQVKYTLNLTELFPSSVEVFSSQSALNEDVTMPITIYQRLNRCIDTTNDNVFIFDRGLWSNHTKETLSNDGIRFVTRIRSSIPDMKW